MINFDLHKNKLLMVFTSLLLTKNQKLISFWYCYLGLDNLFAWHITVHSNELAFLHCFITITSTIIMTNSMCTNVNMNILHLL